VNLQQFTSVVVVVVGALTVPSPSSSSIVVVEVTGSMDKLHGSPYASQVAL